MPALMQAVAYEACRLFRDCLTTAEHAAKFDGVLADALRKHWGAYPDLSGQLFATVSTAETQGAKSVTTLFANCAAALQHRW